MPARTSPARVQNGSMERQPSVSGQASAELRALLHQRLVMTEGNGTALSPERSPVQDPPFRGDAPCEPPPDDVGGPKKGSTSPLRRPATIQLVGSMPVPRSNPVVSARAVIPRGNGVLAPTAPLVHRQTSVHAAANGGAASVRPSSYVATGQQSPKGGWRAGTPGGPPKQPDGLGSEVKLVSPALGVRSLNGDYRSAEKAPAALEEWQKIMEGVRLQDVAHAPRPVVAAPLSTRQTAPVLRERAATTDMGSAAIDGRARTVSCGKLYEELARLRMDNQELRSRNSELKERVRELDDANEREAAGADRKLEELRRRQAAEADRNKDQLDTLHKHHEALVAELNELRVERQQLAQACLEQREGSPELQRAAELLQQRNGALEAKLAELQRGLGEGGLEGLAGQLREAQRQAAGLEEELAAERGCHRQDVSTLQEANDGLQQRCAELASEASEAATQREELQEQRRRSSGLLQENRRLSVTIQQLSDDLKAAEERCQEIESRQVAERRDSLPSGRPPDEEEGASSCSHSRLKSVLTDRSATLEQLKGAIGAAEALLGEAKREYGAKQLRERRACYERLHAAIEAEDEEAIAECLLRARRADVDAEDIVKGEAKLALLRSLSDEQRQAKALHELGVQRKKEAFLLAKRDDAEGIRRLIEGLDDAIRWQDWRDYMGRSLWRFAVEMRASSTQEYLAPLLGVDVPREQQLQRRPAAATAAVPADDPPPPSAPSVPAVAAVETAVEPVPAEAPAPRARRELTEAAEAELKARAFRSVVQDDTAALLEVLGSLEIEGWCKWQNKAGKDLLTLSQERGSSGAYSVLAKALGLVQEQKREAFDEREAVWIFAQGEVQPRRATVLEDTPEEADVVLVEYWDGDEPASRVDRCLVRKMWS